MTNFKRVRSLPPIATVREIVDAVNNLIRYAIQETGPTTLGITSITSASSPYTVTANDQFLAVDTAGGNVTVNLPAKASSDGRELTIKKVSTDGNTNTITIDGDSTDTIDGATTRVLIQPYGGLTIRCDATAGWWIRNFI